MSDPQWLKLGREAAARALYEAWHPLRMDNGFSEGSFAWRDLSHEEKQRYLDAAQIACRAYHDSTLESSRAAIETLRSARLSEATRG